MNLAAAFTLALRFGAFKKLHSFCLESSRAGLGFSFQAPVFAVEVGCCQLCQGSQGIACGIKPGYDVKNAQSEYVVQAAKKSPGPV